MKSSARKLVLWVPALLFSLAGCGLKGPLYLPDEQPQSVPATEAGKPVLEGKKVRTIPPAPQAQKKDRERANQTTPEPTQSQPTPVSPPDPDRPATTPPGP
ncbi:LPS translocon maturation chaperone LptM [Steroidobacter sp.]|uniref:LPS translocon maturation chaperone LptM n=1 Tax=Steroidobacter sp. TaxID=1978227 RepID=UPI001A3A4023|nr:lipoprotein [Steroidobacter sp.]